MAQNVLTPISRIVHYDSLQIPVEETTPYLSKFNEIVIGISCVRHVEFDLEQLYYSALTITQSNVLLSAMW